MGRGRRRDGSKRTLDTRGERGGIEGGEGWGEGRGGGRGGRGREGTNKDVFLLLS